MFKKLALTLIVSIAGMNFVSCADNVVLTEQEEKTVATIEKNIEKVQLSKEEQASVRKFINKHKAAVIAITSLVALAATGTSLYFANNLVANVPVLNKMSNFVKYIVDASLASMRINGAAFLGFTANQFTKEHALRTTIVAAAVVAVSGVAIYYYATKISKKAEKKQDVTPVAIPA